MDLVSQFISFYTSFYRIWNYSLINFCPSSKKLVLTDSSYRNETSSSSGNDWPTPFSPIFHKRDTSNSLDHKKENDPVAPGHHRRLHQVPAPSVPRRSSRLKSQIRQSFRPKTRPHRYHTSAGKFPSLNSKRTEKVKPSFTKSQKSQSNDHNVENEIPKSHEADDIDGFLFLSFAIATDLDKFCTEQLSSSSASTVLPQTEETADCPSGSVVPVPDNVIESDKPNSEQLSSSHKDTASGAVLRRARVILRNRTTKMTVVNNSNIKLAYRLEEIFREIF